MITTSYINSKYYILGKNKTDIFRIIAQLMDTDPTYDYANIVSEYRAILDKNPDIGNFVILKDSKFGELLTTMIKDQQLIDEANYLTKEKLVNALINCVTNEATRIQKIVEKLIKENKEINIAQMPTPNSLTEQIKIQELKQIAQLGAYQKYLPTPKQKLTGYEEKGIIENDGNWYLIDIKTGITESIKLDKNDKIIRTKKKNS